MTFLFSNYLDSIDIERKIRMSSREKLDNHAKLLWRKAIKSCVEQNEKISLQDACGYARAQEYKHEGLAGEVYFCHSLRVASLGILFSKEEKLEVGIIGLLHNVLEVTNLGVKVISQKFGSNVAQQISDLTVDRKLQWDVGYKVDYYNRLNKGNRAARLVKIVDKLDNLYVLNLNSDKEIKLKYLKEIDKHIIPMVEQELPFLINYMNDLISETKISFTKKGV